MELVASLSRLSIVLFAVSSMLGVGFGRTFREVLEPLKDWRGVARALLANFLLVPLLALAIVAIIDLPMPLRIGLFLVANAAGAPFLIKLTARADHDVGLAATLLVLLVPATVLFLPFVVALEVPQAALSPADLAAPLLWTLIAPLVVGLAMRQWRPRWAARLRPWMAHLATVSLVTLVATITLLHLPAIAGVFGSGAILASALLTVGAFAAGMFAGLPGRESSGVLALGTAQRNVAAATVAASQGFEDPGPLVMVVVTSLVGLALLFPLASWLRRRERPKGQPPWPSRVPEPTAG